MEDKLKKISLDSATQTASTQQPEFGSPESTNLPPQTSSPVSSSPSQSFWSRFRIRGPKSKKAKISLISLGVILAVIVLFATAAFLYVSSLISPLRQVQASFGNITNAIQDKDLVRAKQELEATRQDLQIVQNKYKTVSFFSVIPFLGTYVSDGQHILNASFAGLDVADGLIVAIEPYSDLIGFKTDAASDLEIQSIEDRIVFLVDTLDKIAPELNQLAGKVETARNEINQINPARYPRTILGKQLRSKIVEIQSTVNETATLLTQAQPMIKLLPTLLGNEEPKLYMLLFQNDAELRPTGGFMTAYAYIRVDKGKIEPLDSFDIYELDARFNKKVPAPDPIKKYLDESVWYLRNMNLSPDFKVSMENFMENYRDIPSVPTIDGIIAIDTSVPVKLLEVLGPIGVGGWGNFSSEPDPRCNCPQVVYALEEIADQPTYAVRTGRKAVLGPLMHSIMANAFGSPKHLWPRLFNIALESINTKHLLFYFPNQESQKAAEDFNAAGRIQDYAFDYLHISDANFGGAKTDMFIDRSVEQEIEIDAAGKATKTVSITYNNPHKGSNCNLEAGQLCLNGRYRDWVRLYVPEGSKLLSVVGSEVEAQTGEDLGKTVFEAFFTMRPESSSKLVFTYELPAGLDLETYRLLIQKQPGKPSIPHTLLLNGREKIIELDSDTVVVF